MAHKIDDSEPEGEPAVNPLTAGGDFISGSGVDRIAPFVEVLGQEHDDVVVQLGMDVGSEELRDFMVGEFGVLEANPGMASRKNTTAVARHDPLTLWTGGLEGPRGDCGGHRIRRTRHARARRAAAHRTGHHQAHDSKLSTLSMARAHSRS